MTDRSDTAGYRAVSEAVRIAESKSGLIREVMASRAKPRCDCGGIIWISTCTCGTCGKVTIVPEDGV